MQRVQTVNPFARRESYDRSAIIAYRVLTLLTWLLVIALCVTYTAEDPNGTKTIQDQNSLYPTPFALHPTIIGVYWLLLLVSQMAYISFLFGPITELVTPAANVGSHFIVNNILVSITILLFVHSHFGWAELILVLNSFNLTSLYFRHKPTPYSVDIPVIAAPLAWNYVAIFTNGAVMVHSHDLAATIVANVFIWTLMLYGLFFLAAFQDAAMGISMAFLVAALAMQQFQINQVSLQTIFAFVILGVLILATLLIIVPALFGKELRFLRDEDQEIGQDERRPLLDDE